MKKISLSDISTLKSGLTKNGYRMLPPMENDKEKEFKERWKMRLMQLFKKTEKLEEIESEVFEGYVKYIYDYTETHGVRETARRLEESGFNISHAKISQIRNGSSDYNIGYITKLAKAISELENDENKKK